MFADESFHHRDALRILDDLHAHTACPQQILLTHERLVLADDHVPDAVQQDRPRAHRAWRERGVHHALAIDRCRLAACAFSASIFPWGFALSFLAPPLLPRPGI